MNKASGSLMSYVLVCVLGMAFSPMLSTIQSADKPDTKVVRAERFVLVDASGQRRAELSLGTPKATPLKTPGDREEKLRQVLEGQWPRLTFFDAKGEERIVLGMLTLLDSPLFMMKHADGARVGLNFE